jgi:hypothetical protein
MKSETKDLVKYYSGVYLCKICDIFTDEPEKHQHDEVPLE